MARKFSVKNIKFLNKSDGKSFKSIIGIFLLGFGAGVGYEEIVGVGTWHSYHTKTDKFNVCFTPPSGCGHLIVQQISKAKESIYIQAFDFTSENIARELIRAKKRGVKVKILLDRMNKNNEHSKMLNFLGAGIEVIIDKVPGFAHNKIMILDRKKVITGSFNFTKGADTRNAENLILIEDEDIARKYLQNWLSRKKDNL